MVLPSPSQARASYYHNFPEAATAAAEQLLFYLLAFIMGTAAQSRERRLGPQHYPNAARPRSR